MELRYIKDEEQIKDEQVANALSKVKEITEPKEYSPAYKEMMAKHQQEWKDIADNAGPWEWSYGLDALIEHIRWMYEYYELGENVWGAPEKDTRLQTLAEAIYYYDKWQNLEDEYVTIIHHPETYREHDNGDGTVTIDDLGFHCEYKYGSMKRTYKKLYKAQNKYKKLFFKTVYENMESWWD